MSMASPARTLHGRLVLITGAARGIGAAIALACHQAGATVVAVDRDASDHAATWDTRVVDVTDVAAVDRLIAEIAAGHGTLDCLVNNAAISRKGGLDQLDDAAWDAVHAVNLKAPVQLVRAALPVLRAGSSIVNVSSIRARRGFAGDVAYLAAKGGLDSVTRGLAVELAPRGIRVNSVAPGAIETPMNTASLSDDAHKERVVARIPLGRLGSPADVAAAVVFLAGPSAGFITGAVLAVDGGQSASG